MPDVLKSCKETVYMVLGALVLVFGGLQLGLTFIPIVHYPIEICLNLMSVIGIIGAVLSAIKKSFCFFPIFIVSIGVKCLFYIRVIGYLGLSDVNLSYDAMEPALVDIIENHMSISPVDNRDIQEVFVFTGKQISHRLHIAVYMLVATLAIALLTLFLCISWKCCRILRYGRRAVREKEVNKAQHAMVIPALVPDVAPSAPFLEHQF